MANISVNLKTVVANNRAMISRVGANLGASYFTCQARESIQDFAQKQLTVKQGGDKDFIINRNPLRYRMLDHDIFSMEVGMDAADNSKLFINRGQEDEVSFPIVAGMEKVGIVTDDALGKCLRGDRNIIFSDPEKLARNLNDLNRAEKQRLESLVSVLQKSIAQLDTTIAENDKKAKEYQSQVISSAASITDVPGTSTATVIVEED